MERPKNQKSQRLLLLSIFFILLSGAIMGQENCFNGIDDDGDGWIDIQDEEDCSCITSNILLEKSFEEQSCCPVDRNYSSSIDCLDEGWFGPGGSVDYYHNCGWMGDTDSPLCPLPMPSGNGVIGFATFTEILGGSFPFYESLASCLDSPMTSGESHEISFHVGFGIAQGNNSFSLLDITLALYGKTDCDDLFQGDDDCMPTYNGWELITEIPVTSSSEDKWVFASEAFTPTENYTAIGIAMTCGDYPIKMYHFLDDIKITGPSSDAPDDLVSFGNCVQGVSVEVLNNPTGSESYQWYLDGVAIEGAISNPHLITDASAEGEYQVMITDNGICQLSNPLDIIIDETILEFNGIVEDIQCHGEPSGNIDITISNSSNFPITFDWDFGATTAFIDGLAEDEYEVTVTDANGCFNIQSFAITQPDTLVIHTTMMDSLVCNGVTSALIETDAIGGSGSINFEWSTGDSISFLSNIGTGFYGLTVTDQNGCTAEETYLIEELLEIQINNTLVEPDCNGGNNGSIDLTISGGLSPYTFIWQDGSTSSSLANLSVGDYSVIVTDSLNCTQQAQFTLSNSINLVAIPSITNASCDLAADGSISLDVNGTANLTFLWDNGSTESTLEDLAPGMYTVIVSDGIGCDITFNYEIVANALFEFQSVSTDLVCVGSQNGTIDLQAPDQEIYSYVWSNGSTDADQSNLEAGNYSVVITNAAGCENSYDFEINNADLITFDPTIVNLLCNDDETGSISVIVSGGQGNISLSWNNGETISQISNLPAGTFDLTAMDALGCEHTESFEISGPAPIVIQEEIENAGCDNEAIGSIALTIQGGNGPYDITWNTGETTSSISGLTAGVYSVDIVDTNGCFAQQDFEILDSGTFDVNVVAQNITCFGDSDGSLTLQNLTGTAPYSVLINGQAADLENVNLAAGIYVLEVSDSNGCKYEEEITLTSPDQLVANSTNSPISCPGTNDGEIVIAISGGLAPYEILNAGNSFISNGLSPGEYNLIIQDANGCEINIIETIEDISIPDLTFNVSYPDCGQTGEIQILNIQEFNQDLIITNGGSSSILMEVESDLSIGIYSIELAFSPDCIVPIHEIEVEENLLSTIEISEQNFTINEGQNQVLSISENILIDGDYEIVWQVEEEDFNCLETDDLGNCISIQLSPVSATTITAVLVNETGCEQSFVFHINVEKEYNVYVPNIISDNNSETFKLYAQSDLSILESFSVYSRWGERLYEEKDISINDMKGWNLKFKNKDVSSGVYVYVAQIQHPSGNIEKKTGDITVIR